ncbi:MAG: YIP1 family protein [Desulfovibrio sp.]
MRILCPLCGFAREMDESKVPPRAQMATCPKCSHKFRFRVVDDLEPDSASGTPAGAQNATGGFPGGPATASPPLRDPVEQADPMAAQRSAAAEAWKRLQGPRASQPGQPVKTPGAEGDAPVQAPGQDFAAKSGLEQPLESGEPLPPQTDLQQPEGQFWPSPDAPRSTGSPVPFEDLPRHGFFPGLWGTIRLALTAPSAFFRTMPVSGGMTKPLIFHLLLAEFMMACQYLWGLAGLGATAEYLNSPELMDLGLGSAEAAPVLLFIIYPLLLVLRLMLMTGIIHLLLRLLRSGNSGAEATFRVLCYSAAPLLLGIIPGFGPLMGGVWSIGLTILGLKEAHRTNISAAMFAVLVPILLLLAAVVGLMQGMVGAG